MLAQVELLPLEVEAPIPDSKRHLVGLLETLKQHEAVRLSGLRVNPESSIEVGARLTELLPCPNIFKQSMLEMDNPVLRLFELEKQISKMQD
jgi:Lon protease-like protein